MIAAKSKRCDSFTDWVHLIPMGWMNASLFSNLFIFMFFSHRLLFLISMPTLFLLAIFLALYLYKLYIFCFSSLYSDEGLMSETSVSILSFLRCRIYIFITKSFRNGVARQVPQKIASCNSFKATGTFLQQHYKKIICL